MSADNSLSGNLIYAARLLRTARAERLLGEGIYSGQDALLRQLERADGQTMGELAASLGVRPPTVTKMVTRMETQGLVRRAPSTSDSRVAHVRLTEAGGLMLERIAGSWKAADDNAFSGLKKKALRRLRKALRQVCANLAGKDSAAVALHDDDE